VNRSWPTDSSQPNPIQHKHNKQQYQTTLATIIITTTTTATKTTTTYATAKLNMQFIVATTK